VPTVSRRNLSEFDIEQHDDVAWKVFYVVAPDGLCYWFGERQVCGDLRKFRTESLDRSRPSGRRRYPTTGRWCTTRTGWPPLTPRGAATFASRWADDAVEASRATYTRTDASLITVGAIQFLA
jgi:hypothetical protein